MNGQIWHSLSSQEVFAALDSSPAGLTLAEAGLRRETYGSNAIAAARGLSKLAILVAQIKNPLVAVLVVAAAISLIAGKDMDAIVIGLVIVFNTAIGFFQEYRAEAALEVLKSRAAPEADVVRRAGESSEALEMQIPATEVVPGDVLVLNAGDKVPADARIFQAYNLEIDESMLTGESLAVAKTTDPLPPELPAADRSNIAFAGTIVTQGRGKAVVCAIGQQTEIGKIATLIEETEKVESPLQKQTLDLGKKVGYLALGVVLLFLLIGHLKALPFQEVFLFALASAVSSIPEGLPAVMTITLAVGVNRMAKRNAIIRRLPAVDTLGAATVICTDKTGTLTTNQMTVKQIALAGKVVMVTGVGFAPHGDFVHNGRILDPDTDPDLQLALTIGALCNDARLVEHHSNGRVSWEVRGDPTEGALVVAMAKAGHTKDSLALRYHRVDEVPFSPQHKYMATFHQTPDRATWIFVKGAPETVLEMCTSRLVGGQVRSLEKQDQEEIHRQSQDMARAALRVLGLAYRVVPPELVPPVKDELGDGRAALVFVGLVGMIDPPRPEVPEAIQRCRRAGIRVLMATGDHRLTGEAIARQIGILESDGGVLTGVEMDKMDDPALDAALERTQVFARVSPAHKHRIVESLHRLGHVVAMTGDGVNDAPALKAAEIGVAMGITGTDVTKETAEMVLTDDNFASIVNAVEEGRVVFQNVRKVVKFLLATNIGEILVLLTALTLLPGVGLIFTPVQILWVNLVTDGLLDITIALEPKEEDVMDEPPRRRETRIINAEILANIVFVSLFMAVGTLWMFSRAFGSESLMQAQTKAFTTLAMFQVFNALNVRSRRKSLFQVGLFTNRYLMGAIALSLLLQVLATTLPFMQVALGTVPLPASDWGAIVAVASSVFAGEELRKLASRHWRR